MSEQSNNQPLTTDQLQSSPQIDQKSKQSNEPRKSSLYGQNTTNLPQLPPRERLSKIVEGTVPSMEEIVLKDRLPKKIQMLSDCNELRRELLSLLQQEKQIEFKIRREEDRIKRSGQQLVEENERPNEEILAKKRNQKFRIEKQIEGIKAKQLAAQDLDLVEEKKKLEKEAESMKDQMSFAQDTELMRDLIEFKLSDIARANLQGAMDATQKQKQPLFQTILNQLQIETSQLQKQLEQRVEYRKNKFITVKQDMSYLDENIRTDYKKKFEAISEYMLKEHPELNNSELYQKSQSAVPSDMSLVEVDPVPNSLVAIWSIQKYVKVDGGKLTMRTLADSMFEVIENDDQTLSFKLLGQYLSRTDELDRAKLFMSDRNNEKSRWQVNPGEADKTFNLKSCQSDKFLTFQANNLFVLNISNRPDQVFKFFGSSTPQNHEPLQKPKSPPKPKSQPKSETPKPKTKIPEPKVEKETPRQKKLEFKFQAFIEDIGETEPLGFEIIGTINEQKQLRAIKVTSNHPVQYKIQVEDEEEGEFVGAGEWCGNKDQEKAIEQIFIQKIEGHSLKYRAHVINKGWQEWQEFGNWIGEKGWMLEAVEFKQE
ncbi:Conserved_hypothetical protein [Hexamita inflata]|uniref:Uncharacterized protein n=1 Tax=Hexamita inflata TaxID=28002 RepID=A0AA86NKH5_9EUKA|nr:Conserved hypothetical protein [Hexamita inflata]CAI9965819.1 Conserved hypothetical protein [Hexamita inflata]